MQQPIAHSSDSIRERILEPVSTAERIVETEIDEIDMERQAFVQFKRRIAEIDAVSVPCSSPGPAVRTTVVETSSGKIERVRNAFRETVMSVDHYDEHYGESLDEHAAAELSTEVAAGLRKETTTPFSEFYKRALTTSVHEAIDRRETVLETLKEERESLDTCRTDLVELLDVSTDSSTLSVRQRGIRDQLDVIAHQRQKTIHCRDFSSRVDGHDLHVYLYQDEDWTYPVLTAVGKVPFI